MSVVGRLSRARALAASVILAAWSICLLSQTRYLEPLPLEAGTMGMVLLIVAALGAGLLGGWRLSTLATLPAAVAGLVHLSESLAYRGSDYTDYNESLAYISLVPVAIGLGALASRVVPRGAILGTAVLALPLVVVAWAGLRHARPIDRQPAEGPRIEHPTPPGRPTYRGLRLGDQRRRMLSLLGQPSEPPTVHTDGFEKFTVYTYGPDTIEVADVVRRGSAVRHDIVWSIEVRDPAAETPEGVGLGDNLALAKRRYPGISCFIPLQEFEPACYSDVGSSFEAGFIGDPIESILLEALALGFD